MPADTEVAGLSVVVSAEVAQAIKALEKMSKQFEDTSLIAQQASDIQDAEFVEVEKGLKDDAKAHEEHNKGILEGLTKSKLAWAAMGVAVTGAMYGIIRSSSYGALYMARFSSITQQAKDAIMTRYGLTDALDDLGNAYQALVGGSKSGIDTIKDGIHWWLEASGTLKVFTFLIGVGLVAGLVKAGAALVALVGWLPLLIAGLGAVTIYLVDYIARTLKLQKATTDLSRSWGKFKESMGDGKYLKAAKDAVSDFLGWVFSAEQWIPSADSPIAKFFEFLRTGISSAGRPMMDGIKKFLRIAPGYLTSEFVTNINKGIKWLDAAVKIKYGGLMNWSATFIDQIKDWGKKKWEELIEWTEVDIWAWITTTTKSIWEWIILTATSIWDWITSTVESKSIWEWIVWTATSVWDFITWTTKSIWDIIIWTKAHIFKWIFGSGSIADGMTKSIWDIIIWSNISIWTYIDKETKSIWDWFTTETKYVFEWIDKTTKSIWDWIDTSVHPLWNSLIDWTGGFWDTLKAAGGAATTAWDGLVDWTSSTFWENVTPGTNPGSDTGNGGGRGGGGGGEQSAMDTINAYFAGNASYEEAMAAVATLPVPTAESVREAIEDLRRKTWGTPEGIEEAFRNNEIWDASIPLDEDTLSSWLSSIEGLQTEADFMAAYYSQLNTAKENGNSWFWIGNAEDNLQRLYFHTDDGQLIPSTSVGYITGYPTPSYQRGGYVHEPIAQVEYGEYVIPRGGMLVKEGGIPDITINLTVNNGTQKDGRALADEISRILSTEIRRLVKT